MVWSVVSSVRPPRIAGTGRGRSSGGGLHRLDSAAEGRLDLVARAVFVEDEVAAVEPDQLRVRNVVEIGAGVGRDEERVVLAPDDQRLRLVCAVGKPCSSNSV